MAPVSKPPQILLVEDDERIRTELLAALHREDWGFRVAVDLTSARQAIQEEFDLILLDLGLPDGNGLTLLKESRGVQDSIPIVVITARDTPEDRVRGLELGADDYVVKPFHIPELMARIRSVLRRSGRTQEQVIVRSDTLWADPVQRTAGKGDVEFELRRREFDLLLFLLQNPGRPWSRGQLPHSGVGP